MGKNSNQRKTERKQKRLAWQVSQVEQSAKLPSKVAIPEHLHSLNYQLNFEQYKHKECQLHQLDQTTAESLIKKLSLITQNNSRTIGSSKLIRDNVTSSGAYSALYSGLGSDIEIKEIQFGGTGRIFCHFVNDHPDPDGARASNHCCLVAIKTDHIKT